MEELDEIFKEFESNPLLWGMYTFKEHFRIGSPAFHLKIVKESMVSRYLAIAAPRGSAKSTILTMVMPCHAIAFKRKRFILICQNTYQKAARSLENIKKEFKENERLKDFGLKIVKDSEGDSIFRSPDGFETRVLCKGAEQLGSVRGEKFGAWRPDFVLADDLEDDIMVRSAERRLFLQEEFDEALMPCGDVDTEMIVIGTILHDDSLMAKLILTDDYGVFKKLLFKARGDDWKSLWPERWSEQELAEMEANNPGMFAKEYQNDPSHGEMSDIKTSDFRRWRIEEGCYVLYGSEGEVVARGELRGCRAAIVCDLAWEGKRESDYTAIVPGYMTPESYLLVDDYYCRKSVKPDEFIEVVVSMEKRLRSLTGYYVPVGFEKAKLEKVYKHLFVEWMKKNNHWITFKDLKWDTDKIQRIMVRCQPRYAQHSIFHKSGMGELELQLTRLRSTKHDDLADCIQGLCQLLDVPKSKSRAKAPEDDAFMKLRNWAVIRRGEAVPSLKGKRFVFGNKTADAFPFPCRKQPF